MISTNKYTVIKDDIALLKADWFITRGKDREEEVIISNSSAEIVRRQQDGTWLYIIDIPFSRNF